MVFKDLTGCVFGRLTVIERDYTKKDKKRVFWLCKCSCGNLTVVNTYKLKSGHTVSCGCKKREPVCEDLTGKVFGYFTVLKYAHTKNKRAYWLCKCICGKEFIKQGKLLKNGHTTSCGCQKGKKHILDLKGQRFGRLVAVQISKDKSEERSKIIWECKCDCGNTTFVPTACLRSGNTKSCGCSHNKPDKNRKDLTGKRFAKLEVISYLYTKNKSPFWKCKCDCGNEVITQSARLVHGDVKSCKSCAWTTSTGEKEISIFIKSIYKESIIENDRKLIEPKELDIYVPEKKIAIECDGLYWHSSKIKDMNYHLEKTRACAEKDVRLLHIYENEWRDKQDIVKSMIASALGVYDKKYFARNLTVKEVPDKKEVIDFFNENHIQGAVNRFSFCLGLYNKEELIQAVVFGKQHFGRNGDMELYRMVTKKNCQVVGGFSRLMKNCPYDTVVSYVALRLFDAKGYLSSGWKIEHQAKPSFCVTDFVDVYSRHLFKKSECLKLFDKVTPNMTETEMCERNGLYKIWDCGTYKVCWNRY